MEDVHFVSKLVLRTGNVALFFLPSCVSENPVVEVGLITTIWRGVKVPKPFSGECGVNAVVAFRAIELELADKECLLGIGRGVTFQCIFLLFSRVWDCILLWDDVGNRLESWWNHWQWWYMIFRISAGSSFKVIPNRSPNIMFAFHQAQQSRGQINKLEMFLSIKCLGSQNWRSDRNSGYQVLLLVYQVFLDRFWCQVIL